MKKSIILVVFLVFVLRLSNAQDISTIDGNKSASQGSPVIQEEIIHSDYVNDDYRILISVPTNYNEQRAEKYPVIYFLDGGSSSFHFITSEYMDAGIIPDVITIGIGYPGASQRNRDYTYSFASFYQFLKYELIPHIDAIYHTDSLKRTLFGHSFGGLCVLQTLFEYTDYSNILFRNLIAASPSIWYPDGRQCFAKEENLYNATPILPVNLYMTMGSLEGSMVDDYFRMSDILDSRNYEYFNSSYHLNFNQDHSTNKELSFREGIKWALYQVIQTPYETQAVIHEKNELGVVAYPNPVSNILKIKLRNSTTGNSKTELMNASGRIVFQGISPDPDMQIDVSGFPKGLYILKVVGNEFQSSSKITVK